MMNILWEEHQYDVGWGVFIVDARNNFNDNNCTTMMCHMQHMCPSGTRFSFNVHWHWKVLVMRGCSDNFHIKEGVTQGELLAMILYVLEVLPIIQAPKNHV